MATSVDGGDRNISEKKRNRIRALEQKLSAAASGKLPGALSTRLGSQEQQEKRKGKKGTSKTNPSNPASATRILPQASSASSKSSNLKDDEASDPAYLKLSHSVHENLCRTHLQASEERGGDTINRILHDLLGTGEGAVKDRKGELEKIHDKYIHLDNPTFSQQRSRARARQQAFRKLGKRSQKHMSMRQHRHCGSFDFPRKYQKYNLYLPMHEMWKEYIVDLLKKGRKKNIEYCFLTADLHGAILAVVESKIKSFIGVQGIMVRETVNTFGILTSENRFRVVPKEGSVFMLQVEFWRVTIYGDKLTSRNINQDVN